MLDSIPVIEARVHACLPPELQLSDTESDFIRDLGPGRRVGSFLEGPSFDRDGALWLVDVAHGRILRLEPTGEWVVHCQYDGQPNGLKLHRDGRILVSDRVCGLVEVDPKTGRVAPVLPAKQIEGFKGLNDLHFASNGDLYFTDQGATGLHDPTGRVFCLRAGGRLDCLLDNVPSPNGLVLSPDESGLYLAVTRANAVWHAPLRPDGSVHRVALFCQLVGRLGPDGLAVDAEGNLFVAHAGAGCVWIWSSDGLPLARIDAGPEGGKGTTNIAFGGPEKKTVFITSSGNNQILAAEWSVPGAPIFGLS